MYTSGTTAQPKGCLLTHESITRQARTVALTRFSLTAEDRFWDPLPLFHCGGIVPMFGCLWAGARYCHAGHFDPESSLQMLEQERVTVAYPAFETIWFGVLNHPRFEQTDLRSIRLIQNITVPERLADFEARMPWAKQVTSYGSTESATNLTFPVPDDPYEVRIRTLGSPMPGMEIKIADPETGERLGSGVVGELCFRGYSLFEGYYKDPELTAAVIDDEGYFHTGDLASTTPEGNLVFGGRLKDMLKVGGENVSAVEVEAFLATHPAIDIAQGGRRRRRTLRGGASGVRPDPARCDGQRGGHHRLLPWPDRHLQGAALRPLRDRVADVRDQDPEVPAARAVGRRADGTRHHRGPEAAQRDG